jgi:hypothetical protein
MVLKQLVDIRLRSQLATPRSQLAALTLAAFAAAWFWTLSPFLTPLLYIHASNWTDADLVRHLWHFRLIQPEWVGNAPQYDYLRWAQAETFARLAVVLLGWAGGAGRILWRHRQGHKATPPNKADAPNPAVTLQLHIESRWRRVGDLRRSAEGRMKRVSFILLIVSLLLGPGCSSKNTAPDLQDALARSLPHDASIKPPDTVSNYTHSLSAEGANWSVTVRWNPGELNRWVKWQEGNDGFTLVIPLHTRRKPFTYASDGVTFTRYGPYQPACVHHKGEDDWHVMMSHEQADFPTEEDLKEKLKSCFSGQPTARPVLSPDGTLVTLCGPAYSGTTSLDVEIWMLTVNGQPPSPSLLKPFLTGDVTIEPNPQGGANGRQPFSSETNGMPGAAASRRSP